MKYSVVNLGEVKANDWRISAEFWKSDLLEPLKWNKNWRPIGDCLVKCEYGISIDMNEDNDGFPIFRMNEFEDVFVGQSKKMCKNIR